jgi:ubiquitin C-terminal hydrolase
LIDNFGQAFRDFIRTHSVQKFKSAIDLQTPLFRQIGSQHDIDEFITFILSQLQEVCILILFFFALHLNFQTDKDSPVEDIFYGLLQIKYTCPSCFHSTCDLEPFSILKLPIPVSVISCRWFWFWSWF